MEPDASSGKLFVRRPSREKTYTYDDSADKGQETSSWQLRVDGHSSSVFSSVYSSYTAPENRITIAWSHVDVSIPVQPPVEHRNAILDNMTFRCCRDNPGGHYKKQILRNVFGMAKPGKILAIIGSSGCGKSTLLNVLMSRIPRKFTVKGNILANGTVIGQSIAKISAYLQQDDVFHPGLTVGEHLWFHSKLRLSSERYSNKDRREKIDTVLEELGMTECRDVLIGGSQVDGNLEKKTLSGGERKRLAFATEILTNPSVLCCDEPTTGLDAFMAESIVRSMKKLAEHGKTVLCTLHQPSSQIISLIDNVLILHEGRVVFHGEAMALTDYFASIGHDCPSEFNPFDHVIAVLSSPMITFEKPSHHHHHSTDESSNTSCIEGDLSNRASIAKADALNAIYKRSNYWKAVREDIRLGMKRSGANAILEQRIEAGIEPATSWCQYQMSIWRSWKTTVRSKGLFIMRVFSTLFMAALYSLVFANQQYNQKGAQNFVGLLYQIATIAFWENMEPYAMSLPKETPVYLREQQSHLYSPASYFLGKTVVEIPQMAIFSLTFVSIVYFSTNMILSVSHFFYTVLIHASSAFSASGLGYLIGFAVDHPGISNGVRRALAPVLSMTAGLFVNLSTMPVYLAWLRFISPKYFVNELLQVNQWIDVDQLECESSYSTSACFKDGRAVLDFYGFNPDNVVRDILALVAWMICYRIIAFAILTVRTNRHKNEA